MTQISLFTETGAGIDIHKIIGKLPRPKGGWTLPGHKYTGPYNPLEDQLDSNDNPLGGEEPFNGVDRISLFHDICYRDNDSRAGKKECDRKMLVSLKELIPKNMRERFDKSLVSTLIGAKHKLGLGVSRGPGVRRRGKEQIWTDTLAEELHKPVKRKFRKRKIISFGIDDIWAADLVEMGPLAKYNDNVKYILSVIDIFSKYGFMVPLKNKSGLSVAKAFEELFRTRKPNKIWSDKGTEFYNKDVSKVLRENDIEIYSTENEEKSAVVERWNRTMKEKMYKYFSANNTYKYIDVLDSLVSQYNGKKHRTIKMTPLEASKKENEDTIRAMTQSEE